MERVYLGRRGTGTLQFNEEQARLSDNRKRRREEEKQRTLQRRTQLKNKEVQRNLVPQ
jgi:hypothetical protein